MRNNTAYLPRMFALIGVTFGLVFILVNAGDLPEPWPWAARAAGLALGILALVRGVFNRPDGETWPQPHPRAIRMYWVSVAFELVMIPVGANVLIRLLNLPELVLVWVVFIVGVHFLPGVAFGWLGYALLGLGLTVLAIVGGSLTVLVSESFGPTTAVTAGVLLLTAATVVRGRPASAQTSSAKRPVLSQ